MLKEKVKALAKKYHKEIIGYRRHIHQHPELSFEEYETSEFVCKLLQKFSIPYKKGVAKTGIVAVIKGSNPSKKTIALRADMDALPINETNHVGYKSKNAGIMHACGHDVHTSSLLGTAKILSQLKNEFSGTVKLIFQPGEEKIPGGASLMIKGGVLNNPKVNSIFGQHVMPDIEVGKVGFRSGKYMASTDEIYFTVKGKGGHAAMPHKNIDPVLITSHIIVALQQIISRNAKADTPSVLSFGKVIANGATNIIPDEVSVEGTFRTLDESWRSEAHRKIKKMAELIAESMGGRCEFEIKKGYPVLINHAGLTAAAKKNAEEYLGKSNVEDLTLWMAAEDFSYYTHHTNACFYRLGVRNEQKGITSSVHTSTFNIDEKALETGMGLMAWLTIKELE